MLAIVVMGGMEVTILIDIENPFVDEVGKDFCNYAGYNVRSDVVVLYPQARKAEVLGNPKGCWDWWGYTGTAYASQIGIQPASVWRMVEAAQRALSSGDWERDFGLP